MQKTILLFCLLVFPPIEIWAESNPFPEKHPLVTENYYVENYNRMMHGFNQWLFSWITPSANSNETISNLIPGPVKTVGANFFSNLINEPLTIAASLLEGDHANALNSSTRFLLNTTLGLGGLLDIAGQFGYQEKHRDLGLAMCKYGIPAGPPIIIPLVGPRTIRDGSADVVLVNAIYLTLLASIFGTSANVGMIVSIILMETIGDLAIVRQIDAPEINEMSESYEKVRDRYLHDRAKKCQNALQKP